MRLPRFAILVLALGALATTGGCARSPSAIRAPSIVADAAPLTDQPTRQRNVVSGRAAVIPASDETGDDSDAAMFRKLDLAFGRKGEVKDGVYRLVTPRPDLFVMVDGMDVPGGAFIESDFRFWRCPCGKALVNGQFVVADYESNDVVNELQLGHLSVASLAPLLLNERPRLMLIRFQGEGRARELAGALKSALSYTGDARSAPPMPANLAPPPE